MNQPITHKKFIFNEKIDSGYLFSLYEDDYAYIIEVFTTTLEEIDATVSDLTNAYHAGDPAGMKKAAHKMKPLFGFTGLLTVQDEVGHFENKCSDVAWLEVLEAPYQSLLDLVNEAKAIINSEQKRLQDHIQL